MGSEVGKTEADLGLSDAATHQGRQEPPEDTGRSKGRLSPSASRGSVALPTLGSQKSGLQGCEKNKFLLFLASRLGVTCYSCLLRDN